MAIINFSKLSKVAKRRVEESRSTTADKVKSAQAKVRQGAFNKAASRPSSSRPQQPVSFIKDKDIARKTIGRSIKARFQQELAATTGIGALPEGQTSTAPLAAFTPLPSIIIGGYSLGGMLAHAARSLSPSTSPSSYAMFTATRLGQTIVAKQIRPGITKTVESATSTAAKLATNSKSIAATTNWITGLYGNLKNPRIAAGVAAGLLVGAIGSYPFAGFLKEEALQTLSFGVSTATRNNDLDGAQLALDEIKEVLNPGVLDKIFSSIPFVNVVKSVTDFFSAAQIKLLIDQKLVDDMKIQVETGEDNNAYWDRVRAEEAAQDKASVDYYNEQRKLQVQWEAEAKAAAAAATRSADIAARNADAKFWAREREKQWKKEEEDRQAIADFWIAYRKRQQEIADDNRPSKLNFGLL